MALLSLQPAVLMLLPIAYGLPRCVHRLAILPCLPLPTAAADAGVPNRWWLYTTSVEQKAGRDAPVGNGVSTCWGAAAGACMRPSVMQKGTISNGCLQMNPGGTAHHSANRLVAHHLALQATRYAFLFYDLDDGPLVFEFPPAEAGGFW